jgi:hypothetical protein
VPHQLLGVALGGQTAWLGGSAGSNDRTLAARNSPANNVMTAAIF